MIVLRKEDLAMDRRLLILYIMVMMIQLRFKLYKPFS
nr:MAG TPA: hypothetical protein [Caudoviricetes sp.]